MRVLHDTVIVEPLAEDGAPQQERGIVLPDHSSMSSPFSRGRVRLVGPGKLHDSTGERTPVAVSVGEEVLYIARAGVDVKLGKERLRLLNERDIMVVLDSEPLPPVFERGKLSPAEVVTPG